KNGQPGMEVITPFKLSALQTNQSLSKTSQWLLVNRGWVAAPTDPKVLPNIQPVAGEQQFVGYIFYPGRSFFVGHNLLNPKQRPYLIQKIDFPLLEKVTGAHYYPFLVRLDQNQVSGFDRH